MSYFGKRYLESLCDSLNQLNGRVTFDLSERDGYMIINGLEDDLVSLYNLISLYCGVYIFSLSFVDGGLRIDCAEKGV